MVITQIAVTNRIVITTLLVVTSLDYNYSLAGCKRRATNENVVKTHKHPTFK